MSGQEWAPGTVAVATVRGESGVRVIKSARPLAPVHYWFSVEPIGGFFGHTRGDVTDVRPLVTLDFKALKLQSAALPGALRSAAHRYSGNLALLALADAIEEQTRPPKPPEPTGLGAVVKDRAGRDWVRAGRIGGAWYRPHGTWATYADVDAVDVLSEGVA